MAIGFKRKRDAQVPLSGQPEQTDRPIQPESKTAVATLEREEPPADLEQTEPRIQTEIKPSRKGLRRKAGDKPQKKRGRKKAPEEPADGGENDAGPEKVNTEVSRRAVRRAMTRLVTKSNAVHMILVVLVCLVALIYLLSLFRTGNGNFTISLARADMYKYGIEISDTPDFSVQREKLEADAIEKATNISIADLPVGLDQVNGSHNGDNYIAYTFYVKNNGKVAFDYHYTINIVDVTKNLDNALRAAIWYNGGDRRLFAKRAANGAPEKDTIPFVSDTVVDTGEILNLQVGQVDKYTVVLWIEGDDPECLDDLLGGSLKMNMKIAVDPKQGD